MKIALTYAYNGAKFSGSQTQPSGLAAEDCLNAALARVGINERVISSSRTDKGVHALAQVSATTYEWRSREEKQDDDLILYKFAGKLDEIAPKPQHYKYYDPDEEYERQRERDSWLDPRSRW